MDRNEALELVKPHLTTSRFDHTKRVTTTALELVTAYGGDRKNTELAAIFHDYAKYRPIEEMKRWIQSDDRLPENLLHYHHELWHGPVGAQLIEHEIGIRDHEILNAIRNHTTGKAGMSHLDKIVFLADYIEPGRNFPGVEEVRQTAKKNLNKACWLASKNTILFLMGKNRQVYPDTFYAYNDLTKLL